MWDYYNLDQMFFNHNLSISEFFNKKNLPQDVTVPEISLKHVLLHDFGVPLKTNEEMIDKKIREIEETFDLVMIVEHFDSENHDDISLQSSLLKVYKSFTALN